MLTILRALESPVIESLGWALVHFVWQAALLALLLAALLVPFQRTAARARYLVQCAMLIVMALCPAVTWWWIASTAKPNEVAMVTRDKPVAPSEQPILNDEPVLGPMVTGSVGLDRLINSDSTMVAPAPAMNAIAPRANRVELPSPDRAVSWNERVRRGVAPVLPWLVGAWLFGVVVLSLRLLVGWQIVQRLKRLAVTPAAEAWQLRLKALAARLGVTRTIKLVESALIEVPTVIGWIRPVILLPVSVLTNMTPQQLEAVLAHELAHIRRHDYLVNLIQTAIETLLFYHPAVWWLSRLIRHEREHCCDDLALGLCDNPVTYVSALAAMEELRASPALTVAASGGSLLSRIRRIALGPATDSRRSILWGASLIALTALVALGLTTYLASHASDDPQFKSETGSSPSTSDANEKDEAEPMAEIKPVVELFQLFTADNLPVEDVSHIQDPVPLLDQLEKGPRVSHFLMTGGGIFWQPGTAPQAWQVELWNQRFAGDKELDPRVRQLIKLGDAARTKVQQRSATANPQVKSHLALVLRSTGATESIPVLIQSLHDLSKSEQLAMESPSAMSTIAVTSALWELTGRKHLFTPREWDQWWNGVKADFVVSRDRQRPEIAALVTRERVQALVAELATQEVVARELLIVLGPAAVPHLLEALKGELKQKPVGEIAKPVAARPMSHRLAWVIDELGATSRLPGLLRRDYFSRRFSDGGTQSGLYPIDEGALSRALSHCSFADYCSIFLEAASQDIVQQHGKWPSEIYAAYCRRFSKISPPDLGGWTENEHWKKVVPAEDPSDEISSAVPVLVTALNDERVERRASASKLADAIGFCSTAKPETLIVALRDAWLVEADEKVRPEIAFAMCRFQTPFVVKEISQGLLSDRPEIVSDCAGLMNWIPIQLNDDTRAAFESLVELTRHENDRVRRSATRSLASKSPQLLGPVFERLCTDKVNDIREACTLALRSNPDPKHADILFKLADDAEQTIRESAFSSIGNLRHPESMPRLIPHLRDKKVHGYAVSALASMGGKDALPLMMDELKAGNDVGGMVYQHLRRLTGEKFEDKPEPWLAWWKQQKPAPMPDNDSAANAPPDGLEFLEPYPKLHGLSLGMTEPQFLEIVKQQELQTRKTVEGEKVTHHIALGDGHTLIVMFDTDAKCSGIQRVRGEGDTASDAIDPNGEIHGQLLGKGDQPVVGATIACGAVINDSLKGGGANAVTDAEGRYRLKVPSPGIYNVWLKKHDDPFWTAAADDGLLVEGGKVTASKMQLIRGSMIAGSLVDADDKPLSGLTVYCYSLARPQSGATVQSVATDDKGEFKFWLVPGRAYLYASAKDRGRAAANIEVPRNGRPEPTEPLKLILKNSPPKPLGDSEWLEQSTPGSQIMKQNNESDVTGVVVDVDGQPISGAKVFRHDGPIVTANEKGEFKVTASKGTQFILHTFEPGYHVWFGTPMAGDVLKIVLEKKSDDSRLVLGNPARPEARPGNAKQAATDAANKKGGEPEHHEHHDHHGEQSRLKETWGPEHHGLRTRLIVAPTKLSLGWPFRATCEVKNVGSVARTINPQGADYHRGLEVIGPDGKLCEFLHGPVSTFSEDIEIKPGESRKLFENIEISSLFLTPSAGEYTLRLNGGNKAKVGEIDDGRAPVPPPSEVKVTLTEGKLPPIQTLFLKLRPLAPKDWSVHLRGLAIHFTGPGPGKLAPVGTEPTAVQLWFAKTEFSETDEKARAAQHPNEKFPQLTRLGMTPFGFGHLSATGPALKDWPQCIEAIRKVAVVKLPVEVRLVGGPKAEPLSNVKVEFTTGHGSDLLSFGTFTTDEAGWLKTTLPDGFYYLHLKSEKEWPYLPYEKYWTGSSGGHAKSPNVYVTDKNADADGRSRTRESSDRSLTTPATGISDRTLTVEKWLGGYRRDNGFEPATNEHRGRITFTLEPAVELVLRAVDVETGKGLSGAAFYEEVADGEDWAHSVYGQNLGSKFAYNSNAERAPMSLTDNDGYLRRWVGEKGDESKFGVWKAPTGYELVEPKAELSVLTELGQARAEQVFKFRRIRWAVRLEPEKKKVTLGEPLTLTFFVKNATKETRGLELGGDDRNRLGRPESFEVRVINNKAKLMPVPDAGPTKGGLSSNVLLKPDGEAKVELKLSDWATITQPGNYRVFVKRTLKLFPIKAQQGDRIEWGDQPEVAKVAASCEFDVISPPRSEAQSRNEKGSGMSPEARVLTKPSVLLPDHWIVQAVGFDSDGKELVTASNQSFITIRRWDVVGMKLLSEIKLQGDRHGRAALPITLKFSGDRRRVIASTDAYVGIWDAVTGKLLKQLPFEKKDGIYDCAIDQLDCTPDLSVIVGHRVLPGRLTLSYDAHIIVWDGASGKVLRTLIDNGATVLKALDLSTDGKRLVTTNGGGAKIWDVSSGQLLRSIPNDNTGRKHSESDEADEKAVVRSANQRLITERSTTISSQYTSHVWSVQFSPDGKQMAMGDILGVKLLDATSGKLLRQLEGPYRFSSNASPGLVFSKDGERLARLGSQEKGEGGKHRYVVPIWSTRTGAREFELHTEANDAAFSNDGRCLAIVFSDMQQALSVWQLDDATADNIKTAGPGPHSRVDRVEENGHYVGKKAAEYIEQFKPTWGEAKLGLQYGIALTKQSAKFAQGEQVPLVVFFRNASSKPIKFDTAPDFFGNVPKVLNAKGEQFSLENIPLLGSIPHYHETLAPGEALGPFYLSTGLGENPHPNQQHWHPLLKSPVAGQCKLTHSVSVNVPGADPNVPATKAELTSSMVEFEIVDANKREFSGEPPELRLADVVRDFNAANKQLGRGLDQPAVTEDEVIASIKRDQWKRGDPQSLNEKEIAAFKAIAESKRLPKGSYLDVHTEEQSETFRLKQLWQVRLMIPAIGHDGFVGLTIRNTLVAEEKIDPKDVAWGKADAEGLSLGAYLSPRKAQFALGERVRLRLFVRNDGAKAVKTIWANTSHPMPDDFTVTDTTGAKVAVYIGHESWSLPWISSYTDGGALPPGATHALFVPYEISIGPEITYENGVPVHRVPVGQGIGGDGPNKLIGRIIAARPGQTLQLKVRAHNGNDRERKEGEAVPESGFVAFDVADKGNSADLK